MNRQDLETLVDETVRLAVVTVCKAIEWPNPTIETIELDMAHALDLVAAGVARMKEAGR